MSQLACSCAGGRGCLPSSISRLQIHWAVLLQTHNVESLKSHNHCVVPVKSHNHCVVPVKSHNHCVVHVKSHDHCVVDVRHILTELLM